MISFFGLKCIYCIHRDFIFLYYIISYYTTFLLIDYNMFIVHHIKLYTVIIIDSLDKAIGNVIRLFLNFMIHF